MFERAFWRQLGLALLVWAIVLVALIYQAVAHDMRAFRPSLILVHEWYPGVCCGGGECREVPCGHMAPYRAGWRYEPVTLAEQLRSKGTTAWYFDRAAVRESPDGACHVCTLYLGRWAYDMRQGSCAFVPNVGW